MISLSSPVNAKPDSDFCHTVDATSSSVFAVNVASQVSQPSVVLVPETVPQEFAEFDDNGEMPNQDTCIGKKADCLVTSAQIDSSVVTTEQNGYTVISNMQPSTYIRCPQQTSPGSPVFNHQCTAPVPVSSSPSLFDEEEEKRLHPRIVNKNLLSTSEKNFLSMSRICVDASQPSPSILNSKLGGNALVQPTAEHNRCIVNVDLHQQNMISERGRLQAVSEVNCEDSCDCNVKTMLNSVQSSSELDVQMKGVGDRIYDMQILNVNEMPAMLQMSAAKLNAEHEDRFTSVDRLPEHQIATPSVTYEAADCQQPVPKKQRCEAVNSSIFPHAENIDNNVQNSGKLFFNGNF